MSEQVLYPKPFWYPIALSSSVREQKLYAFERLDVRLVLWRDQEGALCALENRCPHRSAALSLGHWRQGQVECGYHGIRFDGSGQCQKIPLNGWDKNQCGGITAKSYLVREYQEFVWIWWGDEKDVRAETDWFDKIEALEDYVQIERISNCSFFRFMEANLDFGHFHFVHRFFKTDDLGSVAKNFKAVTNGFLIQLRGDMGRHDERTTPVWADILFPNLALYETPHHNPQKRKPLVVVSSPVDENRTWFAIRIYVQKNRFSWFTKLYLRVVFFGIIFKIIHKQDLAFLRSQSPLSFDHMDEKLVCKSDVGITHYHRLLRRQMQKSEYEKPQPELEWV